MNLNLLKTDLQYKIALSLTQGIGITISKNLIAYVGSVEGIFKEKKQNLLKIQGIGGFLAQNITNGKALLLADKELEFIEKHNVKTYFYLDNKYPEKLKHCDDAPIILFQIGETNLNQSKILSIVGTRNATSYGMEICGNLVKKLSDRGHNPLIISGLAYGIDSCAHKNALKYKLDTVAVLGHGLKTIYPASHRSLAKKITNSGALLTEFPSETKPDRPNFVKRNRIIAGLSDATIIIESGEKGGALITADIANSYNRDVFAIPGRIEDKYSIGCNKLIKTNKAALLEKVEDLEYLLGWDITKPKQKEIQKELFNELSEIELLLFNIINENNGISIDQISLHAKILMSKVSATLLEMEFNGIIKCLPGKIYKSNNL